MIQCVMVHESDGGYDRIPDAEVEDWEALLDEVEGEPLLIEHLQGHPPYTHAYRLPNGVVYFVALREQD